jgi:hypothetical protein
MARYVEIPAARLEAELEAIGEAVASRGGSWAWGVQGRERVFHLEVPGGAAKVLIFTSLAIGDSAVRGCGKDAIRLFLMAGGRPVAKPRKVLRTAPPRIPDRVSYFLNRLREYIRDAYRDALRVRPCPRCGSPMVPREGPHGSFLGCASYPECKEVIRGGS